MKFILKLFWKVNYKTEYIDFMEISQDLGSALPQPTPIFASKMLATIIENGC